MPAYGLRNMEAYEDLLFYVTIIITSSDLKTVIIKRLQAMSYASVCVSVS